MTTATPQTRPVASWVAGTAVAGTVLIALGAFWLSFTALTDLAVRAGVPTGQAWVWPLIVDGILVVATISVVALAPHGRRATWYPWTLLVLGAVVSVAGNATHATVAADSEVHEFLAAGIAAVPPLVLLAITHLTVELTSRTRQPPLVSTPAAATRPEPRSSARQLRPERAVEATVQPLRTAAGAVAHGGKARARVLRRQGWSNRRISGELGVHPSTIGRWLAAPQQAADGTQIS